MNTFVYTITGQYSLFGEDRENPAKVAEQKRLLWLAQSPESIVVQHRHELFNYMLETNKQKLGLVIGVGTAGKDSVATWFKSHGADCTAAKLSSGFCQGLGELSGVYAIGVAHPGAASARNGGAEAADKLVEDFRNKADIVADLIRGGKIRLGADEGMKQNFGKQFSYGHAAIPFRDFAFGTTHRMGEDGTGSNRRGTDTIQIYSKNGCYNNVKRVNGRCDETAGTQNILYDNQQDLLGKAPKEMAKGDVPYESPKSKELRRSFDEGPGKFASSMQDFMQLDYNKLGVKSHMSLGPNGVYRGRLDKAKILVLADQESNTDMFSGRALTGAGGQKFQSFLDAMGAGESYAIIRTLPVDTSDLKIDEISGIALSDQVFAARKRIIDKILDEGNTQIVIAVGKAAQAVADKLNFKVPVIAIENPAFSSHVASFQEALGAIKKMNLRLDGKGSFNYNGGLSIIPRNDLPAFSRWWMGTSGDTGQRGYENLGGKRVANPDYYRLAAPRWSSKWRSSPSELSDKERESLDAFKRSGIK